MSNSNAARVVYGNKYNGEGYSNETSLANAQLVRPDVINPVLTFLMGREDKDMPLSFLSEGQAGGNDTIQLNQIQYEYDIFTRLRKSDNIVSTLPANPQGAGGVPFVINLGSNWIQKGQLVATKSGYQLLVQSRSKLSQNNWQYTFVYAGNGGDPLASVPASEFAQGNKISANGGAPVSESFSMGKPSNAMSPGKMTNQISILRKSDYWGGNVQNKVVECFLPAEGGGMTKNWMSFERWQKTLDAKREKEAHLWDSIYNRNADGSISLTDYDSGLPIPLGAGLLDQIYNEETYSTLTARRLSAIVGDLFYNATDKQAVNVILFTGKGGLREFDRAMKAEANNLFTIMNNSDHFIRGTSRNLVLGGYFTTYEHIDGHTISVRELPMLDLGGRAQSSAKHPETGWPLTSYEMYYIDMSSYDGERNIKHLSEKGRGMITGVLKGMSATPMDLKNSGEMIATEQDASSIHHLFTTGICLRRNTHCLKLKCVID